MKNKLSILFTVAAAFLVTGAGLNDAPRIKELDSRIAVLEQSLSNLKKSSLDFDINAAYAIKPERPKISFDISRQFILGNKHSYEISLTELQIKKLELKKQDFKNNVIFKIRTLAAQNIFLRQKTGILNTAVNKLAAILKNEKSRTFSIKNQYDSDRINYRISLLKSELASTNSEILKNQDIISSFNYISLPEIKSLEELQISQTFNQLNDLLYRGNFDIIKSGIDNDILKLDKEFYGKRRIGSLSPGLFFEKDVDFTDIGVSLAFSLDKKLSYKTNLLDAGTFYMESLKEEKALQLKTEFADYKILQEKYKQQETVLLPETLKIFQNAQILYGQGDIGIFELMDTFMKNYEAQIEAKNLELESAKKALEIKLLTGDLNE